MKRVYCLYRVSTLGQVEKDDIPMQRQACHAFAEKQGWQIIAEFSEKGVSGFKQSAEQREALVAIKQAAILKKFDVLLVFMFDRLGRRDDETPFVVEWFVKNGIAVWSVMEGEQRFENHVDKLLNYIRFWQSSGESIKTALRTRVRMEQLIQENGYVGGTAPYGYRLCKLGRVNKRGFEVHDLLMDPAKAEVIKTIFRLYCEEDTTKYYTITDTKQFTGLPRNDPSYVPTTTVKDGKTLSLSNISWAVTGTGLADDTLVPTSYTATATYQATGSRSAATGYITTATYTGEITSEGIGSVQYTVTYLGTQLKSGFSIGLPLLVLLAAGLAMLAAILAFLYLRRPNAAIYAMNAKGVAYKKLGRQRIAVRNPKLDFTKLKEYPAGDSSVELKNKLARKLAGRLISIRLYDGVRTHLVEPIDGNETENYWFAVKDEDKEGSEL